MRHRGSGPIVLAIGFALAAAAWGQGGRAGRAGAAPQAGAPAAGRSEAIDFYDYDTAAGAAPTIPDTQPTESHQKIAVNGETLAYTARVGYMPLRNATTGQTEAYLFYTCYARDGISDAAARPLVFFLGGAPGVSAAWQEFGGLGPKRMRWAPDGTAGQPPYGWVDNPGTLLGQADLVFVNPVGTGFSRPAQPNRGPAFWNTAADLASLGEFVRSF